MADRNQLLAAHHHQLAGGVAADEGGRLRDLPVFLAIDEQDLIAGGELTVHTRDRQHLPGAAPIPSLEADRLEGLRLAREAEAGERHHHRPDCSF